MARKEKIITIQDRDQELNFKIREMPAVQLEKWLLRAAMLLGLAETEASNSAGITAAGAILANNGLNLLGKIDIEKAQPLLDELLACCSRIVENVEERCTPQSVEAYIMNVSTLLRLRMEAAKLNLGFSLPEGGQLSGFQDKPVTATL